MYHKLKLNLLKGTLIYIMNNRQIRTIKNIYIYNNLVLYYILIMIYLYLNNNVGQKVNYNKFIILKNTK